MIENYSQDWDESPPPPWRCIFDNPFLNIRLPRAQKDEFGSHSSGQRPKHWCVSECLFQVTWEFAVKATWDSVLTRNSSRGLPCASAGPAEVSACCWPFLLCTHTLKEALQPLPWCMCLSSAVGRLTAPVLAGICASDTLGTDVPRGLCQEEAQDAIDPIGIAVNEFRVPAPTCWAWEEAFSPAQGGVALGAGVAPYCVSRSENTQIRFQRNRSGGCFRWLVSSRWLHSFQEDRWSWQRLGDWEMNCLPSNVVFCEASYDTASPVGLVHKHYMYYCKACNIKRAFMKGNIRGNIIAGTFIAFPLLWFKSWRGLYLQWHWDQ